MFISKMHLSRRTILRGVGTALALPFLDSMVPAQTPLAKTAAKPLSRFAGVLFPHGAAGCAPAGREKGYWFPRKEGADFDMTPTLSPLTPYRQWLTVLSQLDGTAANPKGPEELGADHARSASVFLSGAHMKRTEGADILGGTTIDQMYAQRFGQDTPLPSIELCIEDVGSLTGSCGHGYSCVYANTMTWKTPTTPLPMERDPRVIFERLFGDGGTTAERNSRRTADHSILDSVIEKVAVLQKGLDAGDRSRLNNYLEDVREIERRIQKVEARNSSGDARAIPDAPVGVPDTFDEHAKLMYDLQWLGFMTETTRVSTFMLSRDVSARVYPDSGIRSPYHGASHHGENPERIAEYAKINEYHVKVLAYFIEKLKNTPDGDGNLLDHSMIYYGSEMGNGNLHAHEHVPLVIVGGGSGALKGNLNHVSKLGSPASNALLTVANKLGMPMESYGDSNGLLSI